MSRVKKLIRKLAPWLGYSSFFLGAFLLFAYLTFPYDRLKDWLIQEVEQPADHAGRRHASGLQLEVVDLSPSWVTGVNATGIRLVKRASEADERPVEMNIDSVHARVSVLSLLSGGLELSYEARLAGGSIEGEYEDSDGALHITADLQSLHLRRIGLLRGGLGIPVTGTASGHVDMTLAQEVRDSQGELSLEVADLKLGDGRAKLALPGMGSGLMIEQVRAGDLSLRLRAHEGVAEIERLRAHGEDAELDGAGTLRLLRPMRSSRLDLLLRVNFLAAYKEKSDRTQALFSLLELNPRVAPARTRDGALQYRLTGPIGDLNATAAGQSPPPPGTSQHTPAAAADDEPAGDDAPAADDEPADDDAPADDG